MLNAAVIGLGKIGYKFDFDKKLTNFFGISSHVGAYKDSKKFRLIAVCDLDKKTIEKFKILNQSIKCYPSYNEMLSHEKIDVLSICTPPDMNHKIINKAIKCGVKTIFCEKPLSHSIYYGKKILDLDYIKSVNFFINHRRRWSDLYLDIKNQLDKNFLGDVEHIQSFYSGGLFNNGTHMIDTLRMLFGEIESVFTYKQNKRKKPFFGRNDYDTSAILKSKSGFTIDLISYSGNNYLMFEIDIYGSKGRLRICNNGAILKYWKRVKSKNFTKTFELQEKDFKKIRKNKYSMFYNTLENIYMNFYDPKIKINCDLIDGYRSLLIASIMNKSFNKLKHIP